MLSEADTRAKLIDPAIHSRGWTEDLIRREETAGAVEIGDGGPRRRPRGRIDYLLRVKVTLESQPVAVALIEAKAEHLPPAHGLEQAKLYAACKRLNVPFVFSSNGHLYVEFDRLSGRTSDPKPLAAFPSPADLRARYEKSLGFALDQTAARPLLVRYAGGEATRRYYQDAAIRAQGLAAFQNVFGADAAPVTSDNPQKNARILVATYQTLDVDQEDSDANFLLANYPIDYFSHIVIDECHRSAWGKWSLVLTRNPSAIQVGLTATPRRLDFKEDSKEVRNDAQITADNIKWFGEPVYEYDMAQGIEDGYLAACEIRRFDLFHDNKNINERESGVSREDLAGKNLVDARTGEALSEEEAREHYDAPSLEDRLLMPERVASMCRSFFDQLLATGGPEQKTIIFCRRDRHADDVAACLNNLYADWCVRNKHSRCEPYAFKCTAASGGNEYLADLRGASRLFGREFVEKYRPPRERRPPKTAEEPAERVLWVEGFQVRVTDAGRYIVTEEEGKALPVTVEEYKERLAARLVEEAPTLEKFRGVWIVPPRRRELISHLPDAGRSAPVVRSLEGMLDYDLYDVLAELGYGMAPKTRGDRADAFNYKQTNWLKEMPPATAAVIQAIAGQFAKAGTEGLENPALFDTPEVIKAGGLAALKSLGKPSQILMETKERMFEA
jgi:type I restriction enzyme R subunit